MRFFPKRERENGLCLTTFLAPYRGHSGPSGPKSQKSREKVAGASRPRGPKRLKKSWKKVEKVEKRSFLTRFWPFFDFFLTFLDPGAERPRQLFLDFLGFRARRARMTPVRGQEGCNLCRGFSFENGRFPFLAWEKSHLAGGRKSGLAS